MHSLEPKSLVADWKQELGMALRTAEDLARDGWIAKAQVPQYHALLKRFPLLLTPYYAGLIDRNDPECPIRLQALPRLQELEAFGTPDPLEDLQHRPAPRVTHRYRNRALLHLTPNCSMVCRYCFRKSLLGEQKADFFEGDVQKGMEYLLATSDIEEVIFSGGDPFLANEALLARTLTQLASASHIRRIRFHTRVPVTLPVRVTEAFAQLLTAYAKPVTVVTHFNHPKELTTQSAQALSYLKRAGVTLLNQSVLLAGVNASATVLKALSEGLFDFGVLPYYLHHPDRAEGTSHFDVSMEAGLGIHEQLRRDLPGYLVPRYVVDDPAYAFKRDVSGVNLSRER